MRKDGETWDRRDEDRTADDGGSGGEGRNVLDGEGGEELGVLAGGHIDEGGGCGEAVEVKEDGHEDG